MGYIYLVIISIVFSFGGVMIKSARLMVSPEIISFLRFFLGTICLLGILFLKKEKVKWHVFNKLIWLGAIGKALHYICENYGVAKGFSYGNIIVWPVQSVIILLVSIFILKEAITKKKLAGMLLCILGVVFISWNGVSLEVFLGDSFTLTMIFVAGGIGSALFTWVQKKLVDQMSAVESNLSMFSIATVIALIPVPISGSVTGKVMPSAIFCILLLGVITGVSFLMISEAMKTVPLFMVSVIQSSTVIFSLLWALLFFGEPITQYIIVGTVMFIIGLLCINLTFEKKKR